MNTRGTKRREWGALIAAALLAVAFGYLVDRHLQGVAEAAPQHRTTFEQITVADTAIGITESVRSGMAACRFRLETAPVRWRIDAAPTSTVGTIMYQGDVMTIDRQEDLMLVKFIRTTAVSGLMNVWCSTQQ